MNKPECTCCPFGFENVLPKGPLCPKHDIFIPEPWTKEDSINYAKRWPDHPIPPWEENE